MPARLSRFVVAIVLGASAACAFAQPAVPRLLLPPVALTAADIAVVVNDADRASVEVASYYVKARAIAAERVIHVSFPAGRAALTQDEFRELKTKLDAAVPAGVQAYALAWTQPFRVDCMSITAAIAFGFDPRYCADGCKTTQASPYFNSNSTAPHTDLGIRPAMLLAGKNVAEAKALIDRGMRSDERWPAGKAYLMSTSDAGRNVRAAGYARVQALLESAYPIVALTSDVLSGRRDVMFYFTGLAQVPEIETNRFLDGAIADHLTSWGGSLTDDGVMNALDWTHAGATGSYGTAFEPCNFRAKFPDVATVMVRYLGGETLLEAYWKSVYMPGQGVFVGEPLARPFGGVRVHRTADAFEFETRSLRPGRYLLQAAASSIGPYRNMSFVDVAAFGVARLRVPAAPIRTYRLVRVVMPPIDAASNGASAAVGAPTASAASVAPAGKPDATMDPANR